MKKLHYIFVVVFFSLTIVSCSINDAEMFQQVQQMLSEKRYNEAVETLKEIVDKKPNGEYAEKSQYALISLYQTELQNPALAIQESRKYIQLFPESGKNASVYFMIGFIFNNELKQTDSARIAYEEFLLRFPNSEMAKSAEFELKNLGKDVNDIFRSQLLDTTKKEPFVVQQKTEPTKE
ncbi:MAG: outer membrane protein assembly factor BamD [Ignavibacteria bacterium]|nr:outer membrane protein assembly factor BamD [Ignavibacteria bacterium]